MCSRHVRLPLVSVVSVVQSRPTECTSRERTCTGSSGSHRHWAVDTYAQGKKQDPPRCRVAIVGNTSNTARNNRWEGEIALPDCPLFSDTYHLGGCRFSRVTRATARQLGDRGRVGFYRSTTRAVAIAELSSCRAVELSSLPPNRRLRAVEASTPPSGSG
jgi:hypothetical protein